MRRQSTTGNPIPIGTQSLSSGMFVIVCIGVAPAGWLANRFTNLLVPLLCVC